MGRKFCTVLIGIIMTCTLMACSNTTEPQVGKNDKPYSVEMNCISGKDTEEVDIENKEMDDDINGSKNKKTTVSSNGVLRAMAFERAYKIIGTVDVLDVLRHF